MSGISTFTMVAIFAVSAMVVNSLGIWFIYKQKKWVDQNIEYFMCFAAGLLIASPLISAFPEAIEKNPDAGLAALAGFIFLYFSNKFIKYRTKQSELAFGIVALEGIGIHSFLDGIIYSVSFHISPIAGVLAGIGLVVHEFAEGAITFSALVKGGVSGKKAIFYAFLVAALTTPLGAFLTYPFVSRLNDSVLGLALGFVVGVFIYLSASHLLPEAEEHDKKHSYIAFLCGVGLSLFILLVEK